MFMSWAILELVGPPAPPPPPPPVTPLRENLEDTGSFFGPSDPSTAFKAAGLEFRFLFGVWGAEEEKKIRRWKPGLADPLEARRRFNGERM